VSSFDLKAWLRSNAAFMDAYSVGSQVPGSFERFVLEHGRSYDSAKLTENEREIVDAAIAEHHSIHKKFSWRHCFANSQCLLGNDDSKLMVYVEGFAWTHALRPVLHGWLTIGGKIIDVTLPPTTRREAKLRQPLQVLGEFTARSYFGVPFLATYVSRRREVTGSYGSPLDDGEHGYPLLANGPVGAVRARERVKVTIRKNGTILTEVIGPDGRTICSTVHPLPGDNGGVKRGPGAHPQAETPGRRQRRRPIK
jgi:hypothetical protein